MEPPLTIRFACPAYWPAVAFGGPTWMAKELTEGLVRAGHRVEVVTTSLRAVDASPAGRWSTRTETIGGVTVRYLATPARYRWMGITPTLPRWLATGPRPDIVHVFGYRDVVTTLTAAWSRATGVPYVFEPLDMYVPRYRTLGVKRLFDRVAGERVARGARRIVANSGLERADLVAAGLAAERIDTRPNGFPPPLDAPPSGALREQIGVGPADPLVLNVGRISFKKGLDLLVEAVSELEAVTLALVGPDDGDGTAGRLDALVDHLEMRDRVHRLGPFDTAQPREIYADADVFVLPSRNESFGMVAAEAAAAGTAVVVTDRCGVAELLRGRGPLVVPCDVAAIRTAIRRLLEDERLRRDAAAGGLAVAAETSWASVVKLQEAIYRRSLDE
jgi:glycosyltransferase involved in cell wall biosynthesis